jgi:protein-disulfide isomerase
MTAEANLAPVGPDDHVIGASDPKLTLIEYGDFGCQFCNAAKLPIDSLLGRHPELRLVWRHLPDPELHPAADLAAELSELAAKSGKFWEAHSRLLTGRREFSRAGLIEIAEELELEHDEAVAAFEERTFREHILADVAAGARAGVHGTPTFFLAGELLEGPWRELARLVPAKLAEPGIKSPHDAE